LQQFLREEAASSGRFCCQVSSSSATQFSCLSLRGSLQAAAALRSKRA
jgi:hypothetical protein